MKGTATIAQSRSSNVEASARQPGVASLRGGDGYLSLKALAAYAGLSIRTLRKHLSDPVEPLPHFRIGGKIVVRSAEYDIWVQRFKRTGTGTLDSVVDDLVREMT